MPKVNYSRKRSNPRPVSCNFCRSRKLRCSREAPCPNCTSRNIPCEFPGLRAVAENQAASSGTADHAISLQILERLQRLEGILAERNFNTIDSRRASPELEKRNRGPRLYDLDESAIPPRIQSLASDAHHIEQYSRSHDLRVSTISERLVFRVCPLRQLPRPASYAFDSTVESAFDPVRCIWVPAQLEAQAIVQKYIEDIAFSHHILHVPSLPGLIDTLYRQIGTQDDVRTGPAVLLLCIIASVTSQWTPHDTEKRHLFSSSAAASQQTVHWMKLALDVMDHSRRISTLALEHVQALMIGAFVLCNLEGFSSKFRGLLSMAVDTARKLGLHLHDRHSTCSANGSTLGAVELEMRRRVWWYLTATDWILSCHGGPLEGIYLINPHHMSTDRPRNVNDEDITLDRNELEENISKPTSMTYCLLRIRFAEICRAHTDRIPLSNSLSEEARYLEVTEFVRRLNEFVRDLPLQFRLLGTDSAHAASPQTSLIPQACTIQRYLLTLNIYTLICSVHFPYLTRAKFQATFSASRGVCLDAARKILHAELALEKEKHPFVESRFRFSSILYGILMANTVFVMDMCLTPSTSTDTAHVAEASNAMRILQSACGDSSLAAKVHRSLLQLLEKHQVHVTLAQPPSSSVSPCNDMTLLGDSSASMVNTVHVQGNSAANANGGQS